MHRLAGNRSGSMSAEHVLLCRDPATQAGAIRSLLQLLTSSSPAIKVASAEAISALACGAEQKESGAAPAARYPPALHGAVTEASVCMTCRREDMLTGTGAIQALVLLLSSSSPGVQEASARAIEELCGSDQRM